MATIMKTTSKVTIIPTTIPNDMAITRKSDNDDGDDDTKHNDSDGIDNDTEHKDDDNDDGDDELQLNWGYYQLPGTRFNR